MLKLLQATLDEIIAHARADAPNEACGYLSEKDGVACRAIRLTNVDASPEHFRLDPKEQFTALRKTRDEGSRLRAVYHSHTSSPARPSREDIRLAFDPSLSYVIVSLVGPEPVAKSYTIRNGAVTAEPIEVVASSSRS